MAEMPSEKIMPQRAPAPAGVWQTQAEPAPAGRSEAVPDAGPEPALAPKIPHSGLEDVLALCVGSVVVSFGLVLLKAGQVLTGGTAGLAFLLHYGTGLSFGLLFFVLNLPFYYLAFRRMGRAFVLKTFAAVGLVSLCSEWHPHWLEIAAIAPFYAAILGNMLMALGFLVLFRHKASLGGVNILALYLQDRHGIRAGKVQMAVDVLIIVAALTVVSLSALLASVVGALVLNLMIAMNHRPYRYMA
jgi:uncharacterized membrane-anchored protein YitT (DUF2179 family)